MISLPNRTSKSRVKGITAIHDVSLNTTELNSILKDYSNFIDIAKFGVGTAYITPNLSEKIAIYKSYDVQPYFGGTLFEKFYHHNKLSEYLDFLKKNEIGIIEISTGTIDIELEERVKLTSSLSKEFTVFTEVGSKDAEQIMAPSVWINEINRLFEAGANKVITEGRNSGTAGIYRPSGEIRSGLIDDILRSCDVDNIIFEAPSPKSQMYFIQQVGTNVNLGNVNAKDLLLLESQRVGLRSETFFL